MKANKMPVTIPKDTILCDLEKVRGGDPGCPVQLVRDGETQRMVIRGINEGGFSCVHIDLLDLVEWLAGVVPSGISISEISAAFAVGKYLK